PLLIFTNGVLLLYLTVLDFSSERIIFYLALPMVAQMLLVIPMAFTSDRFGKKLVGEIGSLLQTLGVALIAAAGLFEGDAMRLCVTAGLVTLTVGLAVFTAGWFALLDPLVPSHLRGRFFGKLRVTWQIV